MGWTQLEKGDATYNPESKKAGTLYKTFFDIYLIENNTKTNVATIYLITISDFGKYAYSEFTSNMF